MNAPARLNPKETYEQERVVKWLREALRVPQKSFAAIPNGEKRDKATGAKLERQGVTRGAFDIVFFTMPPIGLEMKRVAGGRVDAEQQELHDFAKANGWDVLVARGAEEAKAMLQALPQFRALASRR